MANTQSAINIPSTNIQSERVPRNSSSPRMSDTAMSSEGGSRVEQTFSDSLKQSIDTAKSNSEVAGSVKNGNVLPNVGTIEPVDNELLPLYFNAPITTVPGNSNTSSIQGGRSIGLMQKQSLTLQTQNLELEIYDSNVNQEVYSSSTMIEPMIVNSTTELSKYITLDLTTNKSSLNKYFDNKTGGGVAENLNRYGFDTESMDILDSKQLFQTTILQKQENSVTQPNMVLQSTFTSVDVKAESNILLTGSSNTNSLTTTGMTSTLQPEISEHMSKPNWNQGMGKQVLMMINQNITSAEIRLNPAHLGPIEVKIDMSGDQVNLILSSNHGVVRDAMEAALPKLRDMLGENGLQLADADISEHSFNQQHETDFSNKKSNPNKQNIDNENKENNNGAEESNSMSRNHFIETSMSTMVDYFI